MAQIPDKKKIALLNWFNEQISDFGLTVRNFHDSWLDGMAILGVLHRYLKDESSVLATLDSFRKTDVERNILTALSITDHLSISRFFSPRMIEDKRKLFTFLIQLYHTFHAREIHATCLFHGDTEWKPCSMRLHFNRHYLFFGSPIYLDEHIDFALKASKTKVKNWSFAISLDRAFVSVIPHGAIGKEILLSHDFRKREAALLVIYSAGQTHFILPPRNQDIAEWLDIIDNCQVCEKQKFTDSSTHPRDVLSGWLYKKSRSGKGKLQRRFFILKYGFLYYGEKEHSVHFSNSLTSGEYDFPDRELSSLSVFNLRLALDITFDVEPLTLIVVFPNQSLYLKCEEHVSFSRWSTAITNAKAFYSSQAPNGTRFFARQYVSVATVEGTDLHRLNYSCTVKNGALIINAPKFIESFNYPMNVQTNQLVISLNDTTLIPTINEQTQQIISIVLNVTSSKPELMRTYTIWGANVQNTQEWFDALNKEIVSITTLENLIDETK